MAEQTGIRAELNQSAEPLNPPEVAGIVRNLPETRDRSSEHMVQHSLIVRNHSPSGTMNPQMASV
jgi:hypothetical protein